MSATSSRLHGAAAAFWREWHRELRRHVGDERLPYPVRVSLRRAADRALQRAAMEEQQAIVPRWNRRAIAAAPPVRLAPLEEQQARQRALAHGIRLNRPIVAVEADLRPDRLSGVVELLSREGYDLVPIWGSSTAPLVSRCVLEASVFVICQSAELQRAALEAHTPSLRIDARDPLTAYPIRPDGLFTLATVIDLDSGRILPIPELLTEEYFRNTRNCGYRGTSAADVTAAVAEMIEGVRAGWTDSPAQARFRHDAADAGVTLGARVRHVIEWDAAGGFLGDGRLARVQAERGL